MRHRTLINKLLGSVILCTAMPAISGVSFTEVNLDGRTGGGNNWMKVSDNGELVFAKANANSGYDGYSWDSINGVQNVVNGFFLVNFNGSDYLSISNDGDRQQFGGYVHDDNGVVNPGNRVTAMSRDGSKGGQAVQGELSIIDFETQTVETIEGSYSNGYGISRLSNDGSVALIEGPINYFSTPPRYIRKADGTVSEVDYPYGDIMDLSGDGSTIIGRSFYCEVRQNCTLITNAQGTFELSDAGYFPEALNYDGSVALLNYRDYANNDWYPYIWDANNGLRSLVDLLAAQGVDISGWSAVRLYDISDNGHFIVGEGKKPSGEWRVFLIDATPQCSPNALL